MTHLFTTRRPMKYLSCAAVAASTFVAPHALACGGFFCDSANPVNQAAERIIFASDGENVTQIVEVLYEGDAEDFSWILPVPGTPTPGVSSVQAFDRLQGFTNPTYQLQSRFPEGCDFPAAGGDGTDSAGDGDGDGDGDGPTVTVLDAGSVGPFDYETISVDAADEDPADVAVAWLMDNGYEVGPMGREVLGPYLQNGLNLIAFRLQKGKEAGAIRPISLEYTANAMAIPIRPTAVAANADMPILVWVLGDHRAVSTNYRGLEINELLIDWFNPGATYNNVVIAAANQAGGQGFVTEMARASAQFAEVVAPSWERESVEQFSVTDAHEDVIINLSNQFAQHDGFLEVVDEHLTFRDGITSEEFASCPYCYFYPGTAPGLGFGGAPDEYNEELIPETDPIYESDLAAFMQAIEDDVIMPIAETGALFDEYDYVTRLYTTMSADEMTLDPVFKFNPDLEDVANNHTADWLRSCDDDSWVVTLDSGHKVHGSGNVWPHALNDTELPANVRILQYSTSGDPDVITDNTTRIQSIHRDSPAGSGSEPGGLKKGGGFCSLEGAPQPRALWMWLSSLALGGVWLARRRRAAN